MAMRDTVVAAMERVAAEQNKVLAPLTDDQVLLETGLDSLCFAILVARLDAETGVDPFTSAEELAFPVTVGDFVALYEQAAADAAA